MELPPHDRLPKIAHLALTHQQLAKQFETLAAQAATAGKPWSQRAELRRTWRYHKHYDRLAQETLVAMCGLNDLTPTDVEKLDLLFDALTEYVGLVETIRTANRRPPKPRWMTPEYCARMHEEVRKIVQAIKSNRARKASESPQDVVRDPVTGKLVYKSLLERSEKDRETIMSPDRLKRRVF